MKSFVITFLLFNCCYEENREVSGIVENPHFVWTRKGHRSQISHKCGLLERHQVSISSTFYAHFFHTKVLFCQNVTRKKLPKRLSYEKFSHKMLVKLTAGVNFMNSLIFRTHWMKSFFLITNWANCKQHLANFSKQIRLKFCWWNWIEIFFAKHCARLSFHLAKFFGRNWPLVSILTWFFEQLFHTKFFCVTFLY